MNKTHVLIVVSSVITTVLSALILFLLLKTPLNSIAIPMPTTEPSVVPSSTPSLQDFFKDQPMTDTLKAPAWSPEQATGVPDTFEYGDMRTAWASLTPDGQQEWLELTFDPIQGTAIQVYETYNPGAVSKATVRTTQGKERVVYQSTPKPQSEAVPPETMPRVFEIPLHEQQSITRVTLVLDSEIVPGWNEIDAVAIRDRSGQPHWATSARASSTFAEGRVLPPRGSSSSLSNLTVPRTVYNSRHNFVIEYPQEWSREGTLEEYASIAEAEEQNRNNFVLYSFPISKVSGGHIEGDQQKILAYIFDLSTPEEAVRKSQQIVKEWSTDVTIVRREPILINGIRAEKVVVRDEFGWTTTSITLQTGTRVAHFILHSGEPDKTGPAETVVRTFRFVTQQGL